MKPSSDIVPKAVKAVCFTKSELDKESKIYLPPRGYCADFVEGATCHGDR